MKISRGLILNTISAVASALALAMICVGYGPAALPLGLISFCAALLVPSGRSTTAS